MTEEKQLMDGLSLYRKPNEVGGRTYFNESCGVVCQVWDTSILGIEELLVALAWEMETLRKERLEALGDGEIV